MFFHEEECTLKSAKWNARALKGKLVGFDGHTIYRVHVEKQNKVIRVKDLQIFEDTAVKSHSALPDFDGKPTFSGIQLSDAKEDAPSSRSATSEDKIQIKRRARRTTLPPAGEAKQTRAGRTVKPTPKAREKTTSPPDTNDIEALVTLLAKLLDNDWKKDHTSNDQENAPDMGLDPLHILATSLHKANTTDPGDFVSTTHLDVEESETYEQVISCPYAQQWAHAIQEEVDQLEKNKT